MTVEKKVEKLKVIYLLYITLLDCYKISNEPYLQTFQYIVINIILNLNERLFKFKIKESEIYLTCNQVDTIEHHASIITCI